MKLSAFVFLAVATALCAQSQNANSGTVAGVSAPTLGFVSGQAPAQLQPILGIPGSARLGSPLSLPSTVTEIHVAPGHAYGLVQQGPSNPVAMVLLQAITSQTRKLPLTAIPGAIGAVDLIAFSPTGTSAAIYSRQTNQLQVLTGLPRSPQIFLNASHLAIPTPVQKLAVSDDARAVLTSDASGSIYSIPQNGAPLAVHHSPDVSALAFVAHSHDSIICDRSLNTISILRNSAATPIALGPAMSGTCQPEGAAATADGRTILLACPAQHTVLSIDRGSSVTHVYNVAGTPSALDRLGAGDLFLMSPPDSGTYWLFVWQADGPVTFFIGAARNVPQGSGNWTVCQSMAFPYVLEP
jgi:hypothetical protein